MPPGKAPVLKSSITLLRQLNVRALVLVVLLQIMWQPGLLWASAVTDSLRLELAGTRGAQHLQVQEKLVLHYWDAGDYDQCYLQAVQLRDLARAWNFPVLEAEGWYHMARSVTRKGRENQALEYHLEALKLRQHSNDALMLMKSYHNIGVLFHKKEAYIPARENYLLALGLARMREQKDVIPTILRNLGLVSKELDAFKDASAYYSEALALARAERDTSLESVLINHIAVLQKEQGNYTEALRYYESASSLALLTGQQKCEAYCLNNIGQVYNLQREYGAAIRYLEKSLQLKSVLGDANVGGTLLNLGIAHSRLRESATALKYLRQAQAIFKDEPTEDNIEVHRLLAEEYKRSGKVKAAIAAEQKADQLMTEYARIQRQHALQMQAAAAQLESIKMAMDNASIRQKKAKTSGMITLFSGGVALIVLITLFVRRLRKAQETTYNV